MTIILVIAALVTLPWAVLLLVRGGLLGGCLLVLLSGVCLSNAFYSLPGGPVPITIDRLMFGLLVVQYVIWRKLGRTDRWPLAAADYLVIAFVVDLLISALTHDWRALRGQPLSTWFIFFLMPATLYWIARQAAISTRALTAMYVCFSIFGVYLAITAFAEMKQWWSLVYPSYITSTTYGEFFGRGRGPLLNPIGNGILICVCMCASLLLWPKASRWGRLLIVGTSAVCCIGLWCTLTRSVWMGGALCLCVAGGYLLPRHWRVPAFGAVALLCLVVVASKWEKLLAFKRDEKLSAAATADSAELRPVLATVAWRVFCDKPLFGLGLGQYIHENINYLHDPSIDMPLIRVRPYVQHNTFLAVLVETGATGLLLFVSLLWVWTRNAWRMFRSDDEAVRTQAIFFLATLAAWFPNAMFHDLSIIVMMNSWLFFLAGVTEGVGRRSGGLAPAGAPNSSPE
jgi:O-antigen ligase